MDAPPKGLLAAGAGDRRNPRRSATFSPQDRLLATMEERADSTAIWALVFLAVALAMTVAGLAAIWLGVGLA